MVAPDVADLPEARGRAVPIAAGRSTVAVVLGLFVLSGGAGLVYEIVWSRQLVIVFGNTTQAVSTILTAFFGGMAVGAWLGGRLADRVRSPLRMYALLELGVAAVAIATPLTFHVLHDAYRGIYLQLLEMPGALSLVRFGLAIVVLGPATILMGATLPSLTRFLRDREGGLGGAFGRLYAANLFGAIVGTAVAGIFLIELLGLTGTLIVGAACSATAGAIALGLSRARDGRGTSLPALGPVAASAAAPLFRPHAARPRLALAIAFVSGLSALAYQVLWVRLVSEGTGNGTYVFTLILVLYLGGLAWGAIAVSGGRFAHFDALAVVAVGEVLVAALALVGLLILATLQDSAWIVAALLVVLPPAAVLGIIFPASSALLADRRGETASETGALLASNTVGAIIGTFAVPFFLVPAVGSPVAVALVAVGNAAVGAMLAVGATGRDRQRLLVPAAASIVIVAIVGSLALGVVRDPTVARIVDSLGGIVLASRDDEIAPVTAASIQDRPRLFVNGTSMTGLTIDTKLMAILPLMLHPSSERALVVAFGMGSAYRSALIAGLTTDAVELVPSVPTMFGSFYADASAVMADPRGRVIIADGRNHVELTEATYDIIVVDPPPPIESAGVSVISSLEFFQAAKARLTPAGVMMQWQPFYETADELRDVIRTYGAVFPNVIVAIGPGGHGVYLLGSDAPLAFDPASVRAVLARPGVVDDISSVADSPVSTASAWAVRIPRLVWLAGDRVEAFAGAGPLVTDDRPLPEYYALRRAFGPPSPFVRRPADLRGLADAP